MKTKRYKVELYYSGGQFDGQTFDTFYIIETNKREAEKKLRRMTRNVIMSAKYGFKIG